MVRTCQEGLPSRSRQKWTKNIAFLLKFGPLTGSRPENFKKYSNKKAAIIEEGFEEFDIDEILEDPKYKSQFLEFLNST